MKQVLFPEVVWFQEGPGVRNTQYTDSGVKLLNVANLVDGRVDLSNTDRYISEEEAYGKYKHFLVDDGDFIIASSGIKVEYFDKKMGFVSGAQLPLCMNTSTIRFKVLDKNILDIRYFMYFLKTDQFKQQLSREITGSAQLNFGPSHLKKMHLPLIDLTEQRKIAAVLDKVSDLIAKRRQQLTKLDELVKARFVEIFGDPENNPRNWRVLPISKICSVGSSKRIYQSEQSSSGVPFWRVSDLTTLINTGTVMPDLYIPEERYEALQSQGQVPTLGDILITSRGTLGQCYIVKENDRFYFQDGMISWLSEYMDGVTPLYISYLFRMPGFRKQIDSIQVGSTVAYLSIAMIKKLKVMLPDIESQQRFASFVSKIEKVIATISRSLQKLETLKKALMQEYFG